MRVPRSKNSILSLGTARARPRGLAFTITGCHNTFPREIKRQKIFVRVLSPSMGG